MLFLGSHRLKSWSTTQAAIAIASGDAEYYALAKAGSQEIGFKRALKDMGIDIHIGLLTDASTGKARAMKRGVEKGEAHRNDAAVGAGKGTEWRIPGGKHRHQVRFRGFAHKALDTGRDGRDRGTTR